MGHPFERIDYLDEKDELEKYLHIRRYQLANKYCKSGLILDLGCGLGWGTNFLSSKGNVIGVDIDKDSIKKANEKYKHNKNVKFVVADAINLPFKHGSFDTVVSIEDIEHVKNQRKYLEEVYRVLKDNGILILTTPNDGNLINRIADKIGYKRTKNPYHTREFQHKELLSFLKSNNFQITYETCIYLRIFPPKGKNFLIKYLRFLIPLLVNFSSRSLCAYSFVVSKKL